MPELGKYTYVVLSAYGASIVLLLGIVAQSILRARRLRRELEQVERRVRRNG